MRHLSVALSYSYPVASVMKPKAQNFQVNLRGVLDLLSDHLYSGPQVYVRELLQNCVDAITARRRGDSHHQGEIRIDI
ncbi:MAG: hypothetical protein KDA99_27195, partial [Planctomycetales bacterium]|nr:hypothetical protein [Planctomycetales bacterium]